MKLLSFNELRPVKGVPYTREHLARKVKAGEFPAPIVLGCDDKGNPKKIAWLESEVDAWIADLSAKREATKVAA
jgi:prophage regulatory protein